MKKYLVWLSGKEPHTGKVVTSANSLLARAAAALHHVETKVGETVDHTDFCARPWEEPAALAIPATVAKPIGFTSEISIQAIDRSWDGTQITVVAKPTGNYHVPLYAGAAPRQELVNADFAKVELAVASRLTQADADRLETLAKLFAKATAEKAWAGSAHPDDAAAIRKDYAEKSRALTAALRELVK